MLTGAARPGPSGKRRADVNPPGMYSVASYSLNAEDHLPIAGAIGGVEGWLALAAWVVTFAAMLHHLYATLLRGQ